MANFERETAELRPAFAWDCPSCGREQFERAIVPEFTSEELEELRDDHGVQPWEAGQFSMMPANVKCKACGHKFAAKHLVDSE